MVVREVVSPLGSSSFVPSGLDVLLSLFVAPNLLP